MLCASTLTRAAAKTGAGSAERRIAVTELPDLSAVELLAAYRARRLSPVEMTEAVIARVAAYEPHLAALYAFDPEGALAQARESEARWGRGAPLALDGVPVTIKENIATSGVPMPLGTATRP
jgi:aspartyl-tRNA(Asn)/glutamyl-tRNA(Gln) amidotransferase subunit A